MSVLRRYRGYILLSLLWLIFSGAMFLVARWPRPAPLEILSPPPATVAGPTATPQPLRVYVSGAVLSPDVYQLPAHSIVKDAILAAGGPTQDADIAAVNMATQLSDGMQVHVPQLQDGLPTPPAISTAPQLSQHSSGTTAGKVNINDASLQELETLPGIGPARAQDILDNRPYERIEDICRVRGIGDATFDSIKELITVE